MERRKLTKADLDGVRRIPGFPLGKDEDIIALSDPPYYTACPNPFIADFLKENGKVYDEETDDYQRESFSADVSEGNNDPVYNAHSYHTKVPYKAIMRYILHYTEPGDVVFDGFCGSGMTGVAAQMCGKPDAGFKSQIESEMADVKWGGRKAVLSDLSPAASFIAYNYNSTADADEFAREARELLDECREKCGWMYKTVHIDGAGNEIKNVLGEPVFGDINCVVWSDVLICPNCSHEFVLWDVALDEEKGRVKDLFQCPECGKNLKKSNCAYAKRKIFDKSIGDIASQKDRVPVLIVYTVGKKRYQKKPQPFDLELL